MYKYIYIRSKTAQARCAQEGSMDTKGKPITRMERTLKVSTKKGEKRYRCDTSDATGFHSMSADHGRSAKSVWRNAKRAETGCEIFRSERFQMVSISSDRFNPCIQRTAPKPGTILTTRAHGPEASRPPPPQMVLAWAKRRANGLCWKSYV